MMRVFIAFFALSRVAFADGYQISELDTYDPFVEEFLVICGEVALSKDQSPYAGTDIERRLTSRSGVEIYYNGSYMFCSFFSSYYSDASSFDVEDPSDHQPWWLKEPENIADSFDRWIEKNSARFDFLPANGCLKTQTEEDRATTREYARAVSIGKTSRAIVVEITRVPTSYLEPSRGYHRSLVAYTSNSPMKCVKGQ